MNSNGSGKHVRNPDTVRRLLQSRNRIGGHPFRYLAAYNYFPIPAGTLCSIAKGDPIPQKWRKRLGLPEIVKVKTCPIHGEVHQYDCTSEIIRPRSKARKRKPRYRPDLPPDTTPEQRERISRMSPQERLERMLR